MTQVLLSLIQMLAMATAMVPFPNPARNVQQLRTKLNMDDNIEVFLGTFKRIAEREGWQP